MGALALKLGAQNTKIRTWFWTTSWLDGE